MTSHRVRQHSLPRRAATATGDIRPRTGLLATSAMPSRRTFSNAAPRRSNRPGSASGHAYRSDSAAYTRRLARPYDARLVQLITDACVGFDAGAFAAPHASKDAGKLTCDAQSPTSAARCAAMFVQIRDQGRNTIRRSPLAEHCALGDCGIACTARSAAIDADGMHLALTGEGRDCLFSRRGYLRVARLSACAGQEQPLGFLRAAASRARTCHCEGACYPTSCGRPHSLFRCQRVNFPEEAMILIEK